MSEELFQFFALLVGFIALWGIVWLLVNNPEGWQRVGTVFIATKIFYKHTGSIDPNTQIRLRRRADTQLVAFFRISETNELMPDSKTRVIPVELAYHLMKLHSEKTFSLTAQEVMELFAFETQIEMLKPLTKEEVSSALRH
jgi:hypothetical protein